MKEVSNPLDHLIELCEQAVDYGTITKFTILNAKDELNKMRQKLTYFENNQSYKITGWVRINSRGDLYDPRLVLNHFINEDTVLPLYSNQQEYKEKYGKLSK